MIKRYITQKARKLSTMSETEQRKSGRNISSSKAMKSTKEEKYWDQKHKIRG